MMIDGSFFFRSKEQATVTRIVEEQAIRLPNLSTLGRCVDSGERLCQVTLRRVGPDPAALCGRTVRIEHSSRISLDCLHVIDGRRRSIGSGLRRRELNPSRCRVERRNFTENNVNPAVVSN